MSKYPSDECKLFIEDFPFVQIAKDCPVCLLNNVNCLGNCHPRMQLQTGASLVSNVNTDFVLLWKAIMVDDALVVNGDQWGLLGGFYCDSTHQSLVIRDWWKRLRNKILDRSFYNSGGSLTASVVVDSLAATDEAPVSEGASKTVNEAAAQMFPNLVAPHMVMLHGMAGRGKSAFLRYLIFSILLDARDARDAAVIDGSSSSTAEPQQEEVTNPRIAFVDRDKLAYLITTTTILPFTTQQHLMAYKPHYFFTDNVDIDYESSGSLVVMALTSGDTNVLRKYRKRFDEARDKPRSHLFMSSPDLSEMITMFSHLATKEDIRFRFDIVGGNPRLAFSKPVADPTSSHYSLVKEVADIMFPLPAVGVRAEAWAGLKEWAVGVTSGALDRAIKNKSHDALDSSTFLEYVVSEDGTVHEAFSSMFMGIVAARVRQEFQNTTVFCVLNRLFGFPGMDVYLEYEAKWAFLKASHDKKFLVKTLSALPLPLELVHLIAKYAVGGKDVRVAFKDVL